MYCVFRKMALPQIICTEEVVGFDDEKNDDIKPKKVSTKKLSGFHRLGLNPLVLKGVQKRGYKTPTPIQRKVMYLVLNALNHKMKNIYCI